MAKLARAGFSYHIAQKVIRAETLEELEEMVEIIFMVNTNDIIKLNER